MKLFGLLIPWWAQPLAIALLLAALLQTRATLHSARQDAKLAVQTQAAEASAQQAKWALDGKTAAETYAAALADRQPIVLRSTNEVTRYAETPAGRAPCALPDRVRGIDALDASLWPSSAPASGSGAMPANPSPSTGGR